MSLSNGECFHTWARCALASRSTGRAPASRATPVTSNVRRRNSALQPNGDRNAQAPLLLLAAAAGLAQDQSMKDFPPDSTAPNEQNLREYLAGKTFVGKFANGATVTTQFAVDGKLKATISTGGVDSGDWRAEDEKLFGSLRKAGAFCNDARLGGGVLWLRRMNGEVVRHELQ